MQSCIFIIGEMISGEQDERNPSRVPAKVHGFFLKALINKEYTVLVQKTFLNRSRVVGCGV